MSTTYFPPVKGFIVDVPKLLFKRCDERVFYYDRLASCSFVPSTNFLPINGGWDAVPIAQIPGTTNLDVSVTSAEFSTDIFIMANAIEDMSTDSEAVSRMVKVLNVGTDHKATLPGNATPIGNTIIINGLKEAATAGSNDLPDNGYFLFDSSNNTFTFDETVSGTVEVSFEYKPSNAIVARVNNQQVSIGEAWLIYPIYNDGLDCTQANIKKYLIIHIFRCRVTQLPGFDSSYKNAQTYGFALSAVSSRQDDGAFYEILITDDI